MTITDLSPWVPVIAVFMPVLAALLVKYQPDGSGNAVRSVIASVPSPERPPTKSGNSRWPPAARYSSTR